MRPFLTTRQHHNGEKLSEPVQETLGGTIGKTSPSLWSPFMAVGGRVPDIRMFYGASTDNQEAAPNPAP